MNLSAFDTYAGRANYIRTFDVPNDSAFYRAFYRQLMAYYQNNGVYEINASPDFTTLGDTDSELNAIYNPAHRLVEFYAAKIWGGKLDQALKIETNSPEIEEAIKQIWQWSNFGARKQVWSRWFAVYGDLFIRINTKKASNSDSVKSVFFSLIKPEHVNYFDVDERGYITKIRIDIPFTEDGESFTLTRIWDKEAQIRYTWPKHKEGVEGSTADMGESTEERFSDLHGEDFIPIVYQPFRDDGAGRGFGAFTAQLEKIDEVNRQATQLSKMLFRHNRALWAATRSGNDKEGRPLPRVSLDDSLNTDDLFEMSDGDIVTLPTGADLKPLVPNINYADALLVLQATLNELSEDLPELSYYTLKSSDNISGKAVRFLLGDMISRVEEVRGNAESALVRANQMALTIAKRFGLINLSGSFEDGSFNHSFTFQPVLPYDLDEKVTNIAALVSQGVSIGSAARFSGVSDAQAEELESVDIFGDRGLNETEG